MPHIIVLVFACFFLFSALMRPLLAPVESILGGTARDVLACLWIAGSASVINAHPGAELVTVFAISGGVLVLHAAYSACQEYRARDAQTIALRQRVRRRAPGPQ